MRKRIFLCTISLLCMFAFFGCQSDHAESEHTISTSSQEKESEYTVSTPSQEAPPEYTEGNTENMESEEKAGSIALFDSTKFNGGIDNIFYAEGSRILVYADSFYLYDMAAEKILGEFSVSEGRVSECKFYALPEGYALVASRYESSSSAFSAVVKQVYCWYFDNNFVCQKTVDLTNLLLDAGGNYISSAAVSEDGKSIGIAADNALYLYNADSNSMIPLFYYGETKYAQDLSVSELGFTEDSQKVVFTGYALFEGQSDSVSVYGTVSVDGSGLNCQTFPEYELSREMMIFPDEIWFPEPVDKATGKVLVTDVNGSFLRVLEFEGDDTGADGTFASDHGKYISTICWMQEQSSWRIRIYDSTNTKLIHEQVIEIDAEKYTSVICKVHILDDWNTCIVVAGKNQETKAISFFFQP